MSDSAPTKTRAKNGETDAADPIYRLTDFPLHYMSAIQRRNLHNMTAALRPFEIGPQEWRILASLRERDNQAVSELADIAVLERTRTGRTVDSLVERHLVRRSAYNGDRRFAIVSLTEAGRAKYEQILPVVRHIHAQLISGILDQDFKTLMICLRKMKENSFSIADLHRII